jgi:hypothetical protein
MYLAQYSGGQYQGARTTEQHMRTADYVSRYMTLTKEVMPGLTRTSHRHWPVRNDHCFQRIVLDAVCGGTWYDHIARPAYKHLTRAQALRAVTLCNRIISGEADLIHLNRQSLIWRGKFREKSG